MRFNILSPHLSFSQIRPVLVLILVAMLPIACFSKANAVLKNENLSKNELQVVQTQPRETMEVSSRSTSTTGTKKREAWMNAGEYAKAHPAIGISVYGHAKDATAGEIGKFIKARFEQMGIPSVFFTGREDRLGASIGFYLKDMQYGPTGVSGIQKNMSTLEIHFPQAWPDFKASSSTP
jgi:hypothetical protein